MKKIETYFKLFILMLASIALAVACSAEDGNDGLDGMDGRDGIDGVDGAPGADGQNGADGAPGADGQDGVDGADGNANVRAFNYDLRNVSSSFHDQTVPELTQEVINNDVILGYVSPANPNTLIPIPTSSRRFLRFDVEVIISAEIYGLDFLDGTGAPLSINAGDLTSLRVVIIESTSSTTAKTSKEDVLAGLKKAGVDISDYFQVMDYYGMDY